MPSLADQQTPSLQCPAYELTVLSLADGTHSCFHECAASCLEAGALQVFLAPHCKLCFSLRKFAVKVGNAGAKTDSSAHVPGSLLHSCALLDTGRGRKRNHPHCTGAKVLPVMQYFGADLHCTCAQGIACMMYAISIQTQQPCGEDNIWNTDFATV